jgi:hypothetical protein
MSTATDYEVHPAAQLFPMLDDDATGRLAEDIRENVLRNPITLYRNGQAELILDGRNRLRACREAGVVPIFEYWYGKGSPTAWVVSQNLHRRHLTESQRAMVAAGLVPLYAAEAKARMVAGTPTANLREGGTAASQAAAAVNVSPRSVESAIQVTKDGAAELVEAVKRGEVAVSTAAVLTEDTPERQREVVARGKVEVIRRAKQIRVAKAEARVAVRAPRRASRCGPGGRRSKWLRAVNTPDGVSHALQNWPRADLEALIKVLIRRTDPEWDPRNAVAP